MGSSPGFIRKFADKFSRRYAASLSGYSDAGSLPVVILWEGSGRFQFEIPNLLDEDGTLFLDCSSPGSTCSGAIEAPDDWDGRMAVLVAKTNEEHDYYNPELDGPADEVPEECEFRFWKEGDTADRIAGWIKLADDRVMSRFEAIFAIQDALMAEKKRNGFWGSPEEDRLWGEYEKADSVSAEEAELKAWFWDGVGAEVAR